MPVKKPTKRKTGRPRADIDWSRVGELLEAGHFTKTIAARLGVQVSTLQKRCALDHQISYAHWKQKYKAQPDAGTSVLNRRRNTAQHRRERQAAMPYVYVVQCEGTSYYKIGISKIKVVFRLGQLQVGSPHLLVLIKKTICAEAEKVERYLHTKYRSYRVRGEWFEFDSDTLECVLQDVTRQSYGRARKKQLVLFENG